MAIFWVMIFFGYWCVFYFFYHVTKLIFIGGNIYKLFFDVIENRDKIEDKIIRIYKSCKTSEQVDVADRYYQQYKKISRLINNLHL